LYQALLDADRGGLAVDLLLQNVAGAPTGAAWASASPRAAGSEILVQPRPRWVKRTGYGKAFHLTSLWYFPRRVPPGYALYHVTGQLMGATVRHAAPCVVTVHDIIAVGYPAHAGWLRTLVRRRHLGALPAARGLIFDSAHARREFLSFYDYPEERTAVVPLAVDEGFAPGDQAVARAALGLPPVGPILLHVGNEHTRKNIPALLEAVRLLTARYRDLLLLRVGPMRSRTRRLVARLGLEGHVRYRGGVADAELVRHYQAADVFVFPSVYEGFGLPVLEALACGCPVVAGDATSVPEITGDAGLLVDPRDPAALAQAVGRVLDDRALAASLRAAGPPRAASFTWRRVAQETLAMYRRVLDAE
jgi:glycosyltransferase involved in cell wall biosynthesis